MKTQKFDVEISRLVDCLRLRHPLDSAIAADHLGGNLSYSNLTGRTWAEVAEAIEFEHEMIASLTQDAPDVEIENEVLDFQMQFFGLDLGVVSAVLALSAMGCVPIASCNGGAFGEAPHHESYPLVAFYATPSECKAVLEIAESSALGIENGDAGELVLFADEIEKLVQFARSALAKHSLPT
jgi:hypothetical protein